MKSAFNATQTSTRTIRTKHDGSGSGVFGTTAGAGIGVRGTSQTGYGGFFLHDSVDGSLPTLEGETDSDDSNALAIHGQIDSSAAGLGSAGVKAQNDSTNANGYGVWGNHSGGGKGVYGTVNSAASYSVGVHGRNASPSFGVFGEHAGNGIGVYGEALSGFAISGFSPNNWSGYFQGSVRVVGNLQKNSGSFTIDHPLDPANKYLSHSFVESPDMMNVYNGNVRTDRRGFATVKLPRYFQALNRDFRYQLTIVGRRGWNARVVKKIKGNRFTIQTDEGSVEVSWQVTGIRKDRWANAHRIKVEERKSGSEAGKYLNPELFGKPAAASVVYLPGMRSSSMRNATRSAP